MKKIIITIGCLIGTLFVKAQNPGVVLANHIADKMKDTLALSNPQRNQVFAANMWIHTRKMQIRQQTSNPDSIRILTQRVEHKRDSLYHNILPAPKYNLYLQKKRNLVNAN